MTIDERLEALVARHEALTHSVELHVMELESLRTLVYQGFSALRESTQHLLETATAHEQRLERLEKGYTE